MIVMGLDQHRAQISAEWLDTATGEVSRARVAPAHRQSVRDSCVALAGRRSRVALGGDDRRSVDDIADEARELG